uniref:Uncharacterized protein n=2 Tax=Cacopsylla melanoneura TaxID=428564 RepID=A0A8D8M498_9HEMI
MAANNNPVPIIPNVLTVKVVPPSSSRTLQEGDKVISGLSTLTIIAKPNFGPRDIPEERYKQEKTNIDVTVKNAIIMTPHKFTEWLFEKGLIRNNQYCQVHVDKQGCQILYKLGIYPNITKFPHSGGFVWVSECCSSKWISVYYHSIFEGETYPPITILKLIYHWLFQSQIVQVLNWVRVDAEYLEYFYGLMRAVCISASHEKFSRMGGKNERIEVAVISLGNKDAARIDVLGVVEVDSHIVKLKAFESIDKGQPNSNKKHGIQMLRNLLDWVHLDSTICIDSSISKQALIGLGFVNVKEGPSYQEQNLSLSGVYHNHNTVHYLRTNVVPMLQNKTQGMTTSLIQQFLDELVWREMYGRTPQELFTNFIRHLAEMTHLNLNENLKKKLERILQDPTKNVKFNSLNFVGNMKPKESIIFKESTRSTPLYKEMVSVENPPPAQSPQVISL